MVDEKKKVSLEDLANLVNPNHSTPAASVESKADMTVSVHNLWNLVPALPLSEVQGLSPTQEAEKILAHETRWVNEAHKAYKAGYKKEFDRVFNIPHTLSAEKTYSPAELTAKHKERAEEAGVKGGNQAINDFRNSGERVYKAETVAPPLPTVEKAPAAPIVKRSLEDTLKSIGGGAETLLAKKSIFAVPPKPEKKFDLDAPPPAMLSEVNKRKP